MIKIKYEKQSTIDTTLESEVDYYTKDNTTKTIYFCGIRIFKTILNIDTTLLKKDDDKGGIGFGKK